MKRRKFLFRVAIAPVPVLLCVLTSRTGRAASEVQWINDGEIELIAVLTADTMWGGTNVWIAADGTMYRQGVRPGREVRWKGKVAAPELLRLKEFISTHDFRNPQQGEAKSTDQACTVLYIRLRSGKVVREGICTSTTDQNFNAITNTIFHLKTTGRPEEIYNGEFDYEWRPPTFPLNLQ